MMGPDLPIQNKGFSTCHVLHRKINICGIMPSSPVHTGYRNLQNFATHNPRCARTHVEAIIILSYMYTLFSIIFVDINYELEVGTESNTMPSDKIDVQNM